MELEARTLPVEARQLLDTVLDGAPPTRHPLSIEGPWVFHGDGTVTIPIADLQRLFTRRNKQHGGGDE